MDEYVFTSILALLFALSTAILGAYGIWGKYRNLSYTVFRALEDGKITKEEIQDIFKAIEDLKKE